MRLPFSVSIVVSLLAGLVSAGYNVGVGRADITGPAAEIGMMGYAKQGQNTRGNVNISNITQIIEQFRSPKASRKSQKG